MATFVAGDAPVLSASDAERLVEALVPIPLRSVGSEMWYSQHVALQRLNLQTHWCAREQSDDFVLEALLTYDKMGVLIHELIVIEAYRQRVYPRITDRLAENASVKGYYLLYHEATLCNLLEMVLYHDYAAEACGDSVIELLDYCCRQVAWLAYDPAGPSGDGEADENNDDESPRTAAEALARSESIDRVGELSKQCRDILYRSSVASVTILRFLCEHCTKLPIGVLTRMLDTHDVMCLVVPLIENPPWTRRVGSKGTWEKFREQKWQTCKPEDLLQLTPLEAQPWLVLYNLMCEPECRQRYHFNTHRKDTVLRVRKYLNDVLLDQIPVLRDVQRSMDELVIMQPPAPTANSAFVMEQIAELREALMGQTDWDAEVAHARDVTFGAPEGKDDPIIRALAELFAGDDVEALLSLSGGADAPIGGAESPRLVSATISASVERGGASSARFELVPATEVGTKQQTSAGTFERFQLRLIGGDDPKKKPLPPAGWLNVSLVFSDGTVRNIDADAELALPEQHSPCGATAARVVTVDKTICTAESEWRKVGSLAGGAVVQVQCERLEQTGVSTRVGSEVDAEEHMLWCHSLGTVFLSVAVVSLVG